MSIKLVTDSTSYIPQSYLDTYDISVVSLNVILDGVSSRELDLSNATFYDIMDNTKEMPTSSQPIPEEMLLAFEKIIKAGDSVLGIFLSSDMSGTFASAHLIKNLLLEKYPDAVIELIDSRSNCMEMGFMVIEAAKAAAQGASLSEIIDLTTDLLTHTRFIFTPDTLDYLQRGGRIGGGAALLGNLLQIKPILTVSDGKTEIFTKVRTKKKALSTIVDTLLSDIQSPDRLVNVVVHHINCEEEGRALAKLIENHINRPVDLAPIGPVIGLHVGPGSLGVAYQYR